MFAGRKAAVREGGKTALKKVGHDDVFAEARETVECRGSFQALRNITALDA
jgi:hypothetical protein